MNRSSQTNNSTWSLGKRIPASCTETRKGSMFCEPFCICDCIFAHIHKHDNSIDHPDFAYHVLCNSITHHSTFSFLFSWLAIGHTYHGISLWARNTGRKRYGVADLSTSYLQRKSLIPVGLFSSFHFSSPRYNGIGRRTNQLRTLLKVYQSPAIEVGHWDPFYTVEENLIALNLQVLTVRSNRK